MTSYFQYRCRQCGAITQDTATGDTKTGSRAIKFLVAAINDTHDPQEPLGPAMLGLHGCDEGRTGISDLIGAITVK